jgi:hypothetical protein
LEGGQTLTSDAMYFSGLGGADNSQLEYQLPVFDLAERRFPELERIQLTMSGPGALRISLPLEAIAAYRAGQLDAAGFLSQMEFVEVQ